MYSHDCALPKIFSSLEEARKEVKMDIPCYLVDLNTLQVVLQNLFDPTLEDHLKQEGFLFAKMVVEELSKLEVDFKVLRPLLDR